MTSGGLAAWIWIKLIHVAPYLLNRMAGWGGAVYFYRKGKRTKKRNYMVLGVGIYVLSWIFIIAGTTQIVRWVYDWLK